ncbi:MAG TPA: hypothetical protein VFE08_12850 [Candidatus Sulfotelmatobacter sp.]|jgi:hypothetical protein|nr:hypothetical protein [Candidatus Sulfotelmatobacter sp.]
MSNDSYRGLLIAILAVGVLNLIATGVQTGLLIRAPSPSATVAADTRQSLPKQYTDAVLAAIAKRVTVPYNDGNVEALYNTFDDVAKAQIRRETFEKQLDQLGKLVGKVESASFIGSQKQQNQGNIDTYKLNYVVRLSNAAFQSGTMTINVLDRESGPAIVGFFINGRTTQQ